MRILHVTDFFLPRLGGIETHVDGLVRRQRAAGHDAQVLTATPDVVESGGPSWVLRVDSPSARRRRAALEQILTEDPPAVVHAHLSVVSPFATQALRAAARLGVPTLATVHSMWANLGPIPTVLAQVSGMTRLPVTWSAVSEPAADAVRRALGGEQHVRVLPNAVDLAEWTPRSLTWTEPEVPTIVSVMRFTRTKRTLPLARILADVRERVGDRPLRAIIVGDGPQRPALERRLRRDGSDQWVQLAGRLDHATVRAVLRQASVFVAPAELESFGIAALEARSLGLPVVAHANSGVREFINHGIDGLLAATDAEMAHHLAELVTDDELRSTLTVHNSLVPPRHDWARALDRTDDLYVEAMVAATATTAAGRRASTRPILASRSLR